MSIYCVGSEYGKALLCCCACCDRDCGPPDGCLLQRYEEPRLRASHQHQVSAWLERIGSNAGARVAVMVSALGCGVRGSWLVVCVSWIDAQTTAKCASQFTAYFVICDSIRFICCLLLLYATALDVPSRYAYYTKMNEGMIKGVCVFQGWGVFFCCVYFITPFFTRLRFVSILWSRTQEWQHLLRSCTRT